MELSGKLNRDFSITVSKLQLRFRIVADATTSRLFEIQPPLSAA